jgi:hypothetical protein
MWWPRVLTAEFLPNEKRHDPSDRHDLWIITLDLDGEVVRAEVVAYHVCIHCRKRVGWDDVCYVHANGFADCDLWVLPNPDEPEVPGVMFNPILGFASPPPHTRAEVEKYPEVAWG